MLGSTQAFSGFAVDDLDAARAFYAGTLGIAGDGEDSPRIAWFTDPAGNILAVLEDPDA